MKIKVVVHEAEEGGFWAEVPAIPGCATQGETFEELLHNLYEAVEGCLSVDVSKVATPWRGPGAGNRVMKSVVVGTEFPPVSIAKRFEFRDFSCGFVDRLSWTKHSIHEITQSRTKKTIKSVERHYTRAVFLHLPPARKWRAALA